MQNMNLSMTPFVQAGNFVCSQYDVGRTLTITLQDENGDYEIPTGATVKIQATKPSGLGFSKTCTWSGSTVTIVSTADMTDESGRFPVELQVTSGDTVLASTNFFMKVEKSPHPTGTTDGTAEEVISEITVLVERAEAAAQTAAEDAAEAAEATINELMDYLPQEVSDLKSDIGDLSELETEDKSSLVNAINEARGSGGGLTEDVKVALLNCFDHVTWDDDDPTGQTYIDALEDALYPPANLVSISAVYTQSGAVYEWDTLNDLKADLVVTAHYDDESTATIATYTLSGTLTAGTSTITVTYMEKTTTFNVTVTEYLYELGESDFTRSVRNTTNRPNYYDTSSNASQRISYTPFDVLFEGGKTYRFEVDSTYSTAQVGVQTFNQNALNAVNQSTNITSGDIYDGYGWLDIPCDVAIPAEINSSPVVGSRFTFRQSSSSPTIASDFKINALTIKVVS